MSRAHQIERQMEREEEVITKLYSEGALSRAEYNEAMRDLQHEARAAYEEDLYEAQQQVKGEWGW